MQGSIKLQARNPTGETGRVQTVTVVDKDPKLKSATPPTANTRAATPAATFWVQVGAFRQKADAINSSAALGMQGIIAQVQEGGPAGWRVRVGPFDSRPDAREMLDRLTDQGLSPTIVEQK
jgi:cell division protein FtsN